VTHDHIDKPGGDALTDPAVEAAQRAWAVNRGAPAFDPVTNGYWLTIAAREALKPLRDLHRPFDRPVHWGAQETEKVCNHCLGPVKWPCTTAVYVYSESELR